MGRNRELRSILGQKIKRMKTIKQFEKTRLVEEIHEWLKKSQDLSRNSIEQSAVTFCIFIQKWLKSRLSYAPRSGPKARKKNSNECNYTLNRSYNLLNVEREFFFCEVESFWLRIYSRGGLDCESWKIQDWRFVFSKSSYPMKSNESVINSLWVYAYDHQRMTQIEC